MGPRYCWHLGFLSAKVPQDGQIHTIAINGVLSVSFIPAITALKIDFMGPYKSIITGDHDVTPIWIEPFHPYFGPGVFWAHFGPGSCSRCLLGPPKANFLRKVVEPTHLKKYESNNGGFIFPKLRWWTFKKYLSCHHPVNLWRNFFCTNDFGGKLSPSYSADSCMGTTGLQICIQKKSSFLILKIHGISRLEVTTGDPTLRIQVCPFWKGLHLHSYSFRMALEPSSRNELGF